MRQRMTQRSKQSAERNILAEIKELERQIFGTDDAELEALTDQIEVEDAAIAEESTDVPVAVGEDQNELANENWPTEASVDDDLEADADALAKEEVKIVKESTDVPLTEGGNQNDKAMKNWPVANREAVAARLVKLAKELLED